VTTKQTHPSHSTQLAYLAMLVGACKPDQFLDIRWRAPSGPMRRRFVSAECLPDAARLLTTVAARNDVYIGVALRDGGTHGGRAAISGSHLAYIESDANTAERLVSFAHQPTMVIASGTPGHVQVYWCLNRRCPPAEVESANRRLAIALAGDPACADAARILRPPGTLNHKHSPPRPVTLLVLRDHARYSLAELINGLPEDLSQPTGARPSIGQRTGRTPADRDLLAIPAEEYVRVLAGLSPNREGKVLCPFHSDSDPSLQLYPDGGFYCFGSACRAGGTIFDFAGRLWGIAPRGPAFLELRSRLLAHFGVTRDCRVSRTGESR
jgi:hypothetical protein